MIDCYWWGFTPTAMAPWDGRDPLFYEGFADGRHFVANRSGLGCAPYGNTRVIHPTIQFDGDDRQRVSEEEVRALLCRLQRILSPAEKRMAEAVRRPFWTPFWATGGIGYEWKVVCPHGYRANCPVCSQDYRWAGSDHAAVFDAHNGLLPYRAYPLKVAKRVVSYWDHLIAKKPTEGLERLRAHYDRRDARKLKAP